MSLLAKLDITVFPNIRSGKRLYLRLGIVKRVSGARTEDTWVLDFAYGIYLGSPFLIIYAQVLRSPPPK